MEQIVHRDLTIRIASNGVVVLKSEGAGYIGTEYVFTSPEDLGEWMEKWYADYQRVSSVGMPPIFSKDE